MFASLPSLASILKVWIITDTTLVRVSSFSGQLLSLLVKPHSVKIDQTLGRRQTADASADCIHASRSQFLDQSILLLLVHALNTRNVYSDDDISSASSCRRRVSRHGAEQDIRDHEDNLPHGCLSFVLEQVLGAHNNCPLRHLEGRASVRPYGTASE